MFNQFYFAFLMCWLAVWWLCKDGNLSESNINQRLVDIKYKLCETLRTECPKTSPSIFYFGFRVLTTLVGLWKRYSLDMLEIHWKFMRHERGDVWCTGEGTSQSTYDGTRRHPDSYGRRQRVVWASCISLKAAERSCPWASHLTQIFRTCAPAESRSCG